MRASAMAAAGIVLSQPTMQTAASNICPRHTSSIESAITSRLTRDARIPSVPMVSPSEIAMVLNSIGVPPAARMPSFTLADKRRRWKLHGMVSIQVLATAIRGLARSESVKPTALYIARAPARSRPSVMLRLMCLRSMGRSQFPVLRKAKSLLRTENRELRTLLRVYRLRLFFLGSVTFLLFGRQPGHHGAQLLADFFDRVLLFFLAQRGKLLAAGFVLCNPFFGEAAVLDAGEYLLHFHLRLVIHENATTRQVAILSGIRNRVAHAAESAFINQVDDQLHLVAALKVRNLGSVARFHQRLKALLDQRSQSAAEHGLLAEQVALGFFLESRLEHAGAGRADAVSVAERVFVSASARVLMNRQQRGHASALRIHAAHQMAGALGCDHHHVNVFRRLNRLEMNAEAMREAKNLALGQMRLDRGLIEVGLSLVRRKNLNIVGAFGRLSGSDDRHPVGSSLLGRAALRIEADDDVVSAIAQVLSLGVSLGAVAEDCDGFALEGGGVSIVLIENSGHGLDSLGCVCALCVPHPV